MGYDRREVSRALRTFIGSFFEGYAHASGKERWADKTPSYIDYLSELWEVFGPEARFVVIVRHGLDVAYSLSERYRYFADVERFVEREGGNVPIAAAKFWAVQNEKIERFRSDHPAACIRIRYENLTADPETTLRAVFEFLGEPWEPSVLDYDRFPHHTGFEDLEVRRWHGIERNSERFLAWPQDVIRAVTTACGPMLGDLEYR